MLTVVSHQLLKHKLAFLRDRRTEYSIFRSIVAEVTYLLVYEATRELRTRQVRVETPLAHTKDEILDEEIVVVPVLRAGLGMLEGCLDLVPTAKIGFMGCTGMRRLSSQWNTI